MPCTSDFRRPYTSCRREYRIDIAEAPVVSVALPTHEESAYRRRGPLGQFGESCPNHGELWGYCLVEDAGKAGNGLRVSINEARNRRQEHLVTIADSIDFCINNVILEALCSPPEQLCPDPKGVPIC